jgi:hypothetical protein
VWAYERQESHVASTFEGNAEGTLVPGAGAGLAARLDFGALG